MQESAAYSAFDPKAFRRALGCFPTGVAVVTAKPASQPPVGITINSFASVSLSPPLVLWSLRRDAPSKDAILDADHFVVNVLDAHQLELARRFARPADDKFQGVETASNEWGAPCITGCVARFECRILSNFDGGDHIIFLGKVERFHHSDAAPLVFWQGNFVALDDGASKNR